LRKGIKIKASLIILSWLVIMAHNMIPHNHQESDLCIFNGHSHTGLIQDDEYHSHGEDHDACRISGLLFHQLVQDTIFPGKTSIDYSFTGLKKELVADKNNLLLYNNSYYASVSLRAPPAA